MKLEELKERRLGRVDHAVIEAFNGGDIAYTNKELQSLINAPLSTVNHNTREWSKKGRLEFVEINTDGSGPAEKLYYLPENREEVMNILGGNNG